MHQRKWLANVAMCGSQLYVLQNVDPRIIVAEPHLSCVVKW
jgi:hypothetical protein